MKKMFAKLGMPSLLSLAFLLGGLFFGANSAQAQQTLTGTPGTSNLIKTTGTWKTVTEALAALNSEITNIGQTLATSAPSNGAQLKMKMTVYAEIVSDLEVGAEVPVAAYDNYHEVAPAAGVDSRPATPGLNNGDWINLYNDMLELLTQ